MKVYLKAKLTQRHGNWFGMVGPNVELGDQVWDLGTTAENRTESHPQKSQQ